MAPQYSNENNGNRVPVAVVHHGNLATSHADGHGSLLRKDPYGTPVERAAAVAAGTGHERRHGILHRSGSSSSSSSSSSSEDDGQGGRSKKSSLKSKIKEKLPAGGRKNGVGHTAKPSGGVGHAAAWGTTTTTTTTATANGGPREKKGFMEKIKEKLPGHN